MTCICRVKRKLFRDEVERRIPVMGCPEHDPAFVEQQGDIDEEPACGNCEFFESDSGGPGFGRCEEPMRRSGRHFVSAAETCNHHKFLTEPRLLKPASGLADCFSGTLGEMPSGPIWRTAHVEIGGRRAIVVVGPGVAFSVPRGVARSLGEKLIAADPAEG